MALSISSSDRRDRSDGYDSTFVDSGSSYLASHQALASLGRDYSSDRRGVLHGDWNIYRGFRWFLWDVLRFGFYSARSESEISLEKAGEDLYEETLQQSKCLIALEKV